MVRSTVPRQGSMNGRSDCDTIFCITASIASAALKPHGIAGVVIAASVTAIGGLRLDIMLTFRSMPVPLVPLGWVGNVAVAVPAVLAASVSVAAAFGTCRCCGSGLSLSLFVLSCLSLFCSVCSAALGGVAVWVGTFVCAPVPVEHHVGEPPCLTNQVNLCCSHWQC